METPVRVLRWPGGGVDRGTLSTDRSESSYGLPVLLIDGEVYGTGELPLGVRIGREDITDEGLFRSAIKAGYPFVGPERRGGDIE